MVQHGQVFKLKAKGAKGQALWAYRHRLEGRGSSRPQVAGFATRAEAKRALQKVVERLGPAGRGASMTLGELVEEYLEMHQAEPVTIAKLRWLLGKARPCSARSDWRSYFPSGCTHGGSPFPKGTASKRRKRCGRC